MLSVNAPTLVFPNGGEKLSSPTVTLRWNSPSRVDSADRDGYVEVFYCVDYDPRSGGDWVMIARVPAETSQFEWRVSPTVSSERLRVSVRCLNSRGERSDRSISASDISINRRAIPTPTIISPRRSDRVDDKVQIVVTCDGLPKRSYYQLAYSSAKANIPVTSIAQSLLARDIPFVWVTAELPTADDYVIYASVIDSDGRTSETVSVGPFSVVHEGFFLFDTLPPKAEIVVEGGNTFVNSKDISVGVYADDEATSPQAIRLSDVDQSAPAQKATPATGYTLGGEDGIKRISLLVQDFGGNRNLDAPTMPVPVNALRVEGANVTDFDLQVGAGFRLGAATTGQSASAYQSVTTEEVRGFPRRLRAIPGQPVSVAVSQDAYYVASLDPDGISRIRRSGSFGWDVVFTMVAGVSVTSICAFGSGVLIGGSDGSLRSFDGAVAISVTSLNSIPASASGQPVSSIEPVGALRALVSYANSTVVGVVTDDGVKYV